MSIKNVVTPLLILQSIPMPNGLNGRNRSGPPRGKAARSTLQPGVVTRREWLRFLSHVSLGTRCACQATPLHHHWIWRSQLSPDGYGCFRWRGRTYQSHRFACIALGKDITPPLVPDHVCRVRSCCNPVCLEIVTRHVNILRGEGLAATYIRRTHCAKGHLLAGTNVVILHKHGYEVRQCRLCRNTRAAILGAAKKQARGQGAPSPMAVIPPVSLWPNCWQFESRDRAITQAMLQGTATKLLCQRYGLHRTRVHQIMRQTCARLRPDWVDERGYSVVWSMSLQALRLHHREFQL
jgi:hypothetical protein